MIKHIKSRFLNLTFKLKIYVLLTLLLTFTNGYFYYYLSEEILTETLFGVIVFSLYEIFSILTIFIFAEMIKKDAI